jgi:hypothetical protein
MRTRRRLAALAALLALSAPVAAQQTWGRWTPGSAAFGHFSWGPPVANLAALPTCNAGLDGVVRVVLDTGSGDAGLRQCVDGEWAEIGSAGVTDHGALTGLGDDDHTGYALLAGRSGGQIVNGGITSAQGLSLRANSVDGASGARVNIFGSTDPSSAEYVHINGAGTGGVLLASPNESSYLDIYDGTVYMRSTSAAILRLDEEGIIRSAAGEFIYEGGPFVHSGTGADPSCSAGEFKLWSHYGDGKWRVCESGTTRDLLDSGAVGLGELADDLGCTASQDVRRNAADNGWECYTPSASGIGGSLGATDNVVPRTSGTGGATLEGTGVTIDDSNNMAVPGRVTPGDIVTNGFVIAGNFNAALARGTDLGGGDVGLAMSLSRAVCWSDGGTSEASLNTCLSRGTASGVVYLRNALRLAPVSAPPVTCGDANTAGVIYTDSDSSELCFCDGSSWTGLKAAGACS